MKPGLKLISTLLLLVLTLAPVICPLVLQLQQHSIQQKMKERLEEDILHTVTVAKADIHWIEPGKEIVLGDHMFDIKNVTDQGNGFLLIKGIYDFEETFLVGQMNKKQQDDTNNGNKLLVQALQLMQALPEDWTGDGLTPQPISGIRFCVNEDAPPSPFKNIPTPPPQA